MPDKVDRQAGRQEFLESLLPASCSLIPVGMTLVTGLAVELVAGHVVVFFGEFVGVVMFVAIDTAEGFEIAGGGVALGTICPLAFVFA